jgi:hypothetical protein
MDGCGDGSSGAEASSSAIGSGLTRPGGEEDDDAENEIGEEEEHGCRCSTAGGGGDGDRFFCTQCLAGGKESGYVLLLATETESEARFNLQSFRL